MTNDGVRIGIMVLTTSGLVLSCPDIIAGEGVAAQERQMPTTKQRTTLLLCDRGRGLDLLKEALHDEALDL